MNSISKGLTTDEKMFFLKCCTYLMSSDAKIAKEEIDILNFLISAYELNEQQGQEIKKITPGDTLLTQAKDTIKSRKNALLLINELLIVTNIDNDIKPEEINFIEKISETLNIEKTKVLELNQILLEKKLINIKEKYALEIND